MFVLVCPTVCVIPVTAAAVIDWTELLFIKNIALDFNEVRSVNFIKTLTYFRKSLLGGKYETMSQTSNMSSMLPIFL